MIKFEDGVDSIVSILTDALNDAELQTDYRFYVGKNIEDYVRNTPFVEAPQEGVETPENKRPIINCFFLRYPSEIAPLKEIKDITVTGMLRIMAKQSYADTINNIIQNFVEINNATVGIVGGYSYIMELSTVGGGNASPRPNVGSSTEFLVRCAFRFILGAVVSNNVHVLLNGEEVSYFSFSSPRVRIPQTDNILGSQEMQNYIAQQGINFALSVPYVSGGAVAELARDIYAGDINKTYKLAYYDGVIATQATAIEYDVVLVSAEPAYIPGKIAAIQMTFSIAREDVYSTETGV